MDRMCRMPSSVTACCTEVTGCRKAKSEELTVRITSPELAAKVTMEAEAHALTSVEEATGTSEAFLARAQPYKRHPGIVLRTGLRNVDALLPKPLVDSLTVLLIEVEPQRRSREKRKQNRNNK